MFTHKIPLKGNAASVVKQKDINFQERMMEINILNHTTGIATLGGIAVLILLAPVNGGYIVRQIGKLQVIIMVQYLNGI